MICIHMTDGRWYEVSQTYSDVHRAFQESFRHMGFASLTRETDGKKILINVSQVTVYAEPGEEGTRL